MCLLVFCKYHLPLLRGFATTLFPNLKKSCYRIKVISGNAFYMSEHWFQKPTDGNEHIQTEITILRQQKGCMHSGVCLKTLPGIYDLKAKRWFLNGRRPQPAMLKSSHLSTFFFDLYHLPLLCYSGTLH
jgi:hypothetical protein